MVEYLRPGVFFEEKRTTYKGFVTVFTFNLEGMNNCAVALSFSQIETLQVLESYIETVLLSIQNS